MIICNKKLQCTPQCTDYLLLGFFKWVGLLYREHNSCIECPADTPVI